MKSPLLSFDDLWILFILQKIYLTFKNKSIPKGCFLLLWRILENLSVGWIMRACLTHSNVFRKKWRSQIITPAMSFFFFNQSIFSWSLLYPFNYNMYRLIFNHETRRFIVHVHCLIGRRFRVLHKQEIVW